MAHAVSNPLLQRLNQIPAARLEAHQRLMLWLVSKAGGLGGQGSKAARYGTALGAVAVATLIRMLLDPVFGERAPYGVYLVATVFVVWRAGFGPALAAMICGTMLARYLFEAPRGSASLFTEASQVSIAMSLIIGIVTTVLCESLRVTALDNARLYQEARQADARKDQFLATLGHELRNPLVPIRNAIYLLQSIQPQEPRVVELNELIGHQTEHLIRLVNDLLDVARITQGKIELRCEQSPLHPIIDSAIEIVRPMFVEKRLDFQKSLPPRGVSLYADPVRVTQIVANLLQNAAKYTDEGGRIWLTVEQDDRQLLIRVRDNGIGIPPEMCARIFEPFEQVDQAIERSQGGLGIGLTLVRTLVELHGGSVDARSPGLGMGSEFSVRLPVVASVATDHVDAAPPFTLTARQNGGPLRILVVDDSHSAATSLANLLKLWGHEVRVNHDGFTALEAVNDFQPQLILADLGMPRMSGYEFAKEVRRRPELQDVVLIALTGYGLERDQQRSRTAGFARHVVKPVDPVQLKEMLASWTLDETAPPSEIADDDARESNG